MTIALYVAKRIAAALLTLLLVCFFTFLIFFALSPDPAVNICGTTCTPERIAFIRGQLGLDRPFLAQFATFLGGLVAGRTYGQGEQAVACPGPCLGYSFQTSQPVTEMMADRIPVTLVLALGAAVLWLFYGVISGVISAYREGKAIDRVFNGISLLGIALPNYFVALILQFVLVVKLGLLPFPSAVSFSEDPVLFFQSYLMPWMVLALMYAALYTRLTRANVLETFQENYMRTAYAKGLPPRQIMFRHALRPSLTPIVTIFGIDLAQLLGGALITETVFGLNGVGKMARDAIASNDQPVIMAATLLAAFVMIASNLVVDILYALLDPRVRTR